MVELLCQHFLSLRVKQTLDTLVSPMYHFFSFAEVIPLNHAAVPTRLRCLPELRLASKLFPLGARHRRLLVNCRLPTLLLLFISQSNENPRGRLLLLA